MLYCVYGHMYIHIVLYIDIKVYGYVYSSNPTFLPPDPPPKAPPPQSPTLPHMAPGTVNPHRAYSSVVRTRMNTHSIVMVGEVDCCDYVSIYVIMTIVLACCCALEFNL